MAFCSGSGNSAVPELARAGVDTLVTGELREEWFNTAQELKLNLYLCGHYATEVHGVKALAAALARSSGCPGPSSPPATRCETGRGGPEFGLPFPAETSPNPPP